MFGRAFWGARYFGPSYWGDGGAGAPPAVVVDTPVTHVGAGYLKALGDAEYEIYRHGPTVPQWYVKKLDRIAKPKPKTADQPPKWVKEFVEETDVEWSVHLAAVDLILSRIDTKLRAATEAWLRRRIAEEMDEEEAISVLLLN